MCKGYFARAWNASSAGQSSRGNGVVRRAEGADGYQRGFGVDKSRYRIDIGGFDRLFKAHSGQDGGHTLCKHALAGTRRAYHNNVVSSACGDLKRFFGVLLTLYIGKVERVVVVLYVGDVWLGRGYRFRAGGIIQQLP